MLSARFSLHVEDTKEGATEMLTVVLAKETLPVK